MEITGVNCDREIIVIMSIEELNELINYKIAQTYDIGFNEGFEMSEKKENEKHTE